MEQLAYSDAYRAAAGGKRNGSRAIRRPDRDQQGFSLIQFGCVDAECRIKKTGYRKFFCNPLI
jgi:hypothetical protein